MSLDRREDTRPRGCSAAGMLGGEDARRRGCSAAITHSIFRAMKVSWSTATAAAIFHELLR